MSRVLVVDDEQVIRWALQENFESCGWEVEAAAGVQEALDRFRASSFPLVVTDMKMPDGDGLAVMRSVRAISPKTAVIFLSGYGSVPAAVEAMKGGAVEYFVKPVAFHRLEKAARRVLSQISCEPALPAAGNNLGNSVLLQSSRDAVVVNRQKLCECAAGIIKRGRKRTVCPADSPRQPAARER